MSVDTSLAKLEALGRPICVGMVGAGATGRAIALQLGTPVPGIRLVAIANRTAEHAERAFCEAGIGNFTRVDSFAKAEEHIARGIPVLTALSPNSRAEDRCRRKHQGDGRLLPEPRHSTNVR
jgi:predicted homoserine dehydrogenase-like protein